MLANFKKSVTITGQSVIEKTEGEVTTKVVAEGYSATIDSTNPEDMNISSWQQDKAAYKANRVQCRKDAADFEDMVYNVQDKMIAEKAASETK